MLTPSRLALIVAATVCWSFVALGQGYRGGNRGPGSPYGRMYDPRTVENQQGEITKIERIPSRGRMFRGVHALLKTDQGETLPVHLGPEWFIDEQEIVLEAGDKVQVRGSRVSFAGKPALIAAELTKDGRTLRLRDENGVPRWSGWRRRGP
jgi:hypothetical protein